MIRTVVLLALLALGAARTARAHEVRPGFLELRETAPGTYALLWKQPSGGEVELRLAPVFPPECAFASRDRQRLTPGALVVRGTLQCQDGIAGKTIVIAGLEATITDVLVRLHHADGRLESYMVRPVNPSVTFGRDTGSLERSFGYLRLGVDHILLGVDHLLFVLGLLLIARGNMMLLKTITAFTVAHSVTLAAATLGYASAPVLALNVAIALSILFLGPEMVRARASGTSLTIRNPWVVAFAFGLLHGFGFASGLTTLGLARAEIPMALLLFNVGVEVGQLLFVALILLLARSFRVLQIAWPRWAYGLPAYTVGMLGAYWTIQRLSVLLGSL